MEEEMSFNKIKTAYIVIGDRGPRLRGTRVYKINKKVDKVNIGFLVGHYTK